MNSIKKIWKTWVIILNIAYLTTLKVSTRKQQEYPEVTGQLYSRHADLEVNALLGRPHNKPDEGSYVGQLVWLSLSGDITAAKADTENHMENEPYKEKSEPHLLITSEDKGLIR